MNAALSCDSVSLIYSSVFFIGSLPKGRCAFCVSEVASRGISGPDGQGLSGGLGQRGDVTACILIYGDPLEGSAGITNI